MLAAALSGGCGVTIVDIAVGGEAARRGARWCVPDAGAATALLARFAEAAGAGAGSAGAGASQRLA